MNNQNISPELKDIMEMLNRYLAVNNHKCCVLLSFLAFKNNNEFKNEACKTMIYGDSFILEEMVKDLNRKIDENKGFDGFVGERR